MPDLRVGQFSRVDSIALDPAERKDLPVYDVCLMRLELACQSILSKNATCHVLRGVLSCPVPPRKPGASRRRVPREQEYRGRDMSEKNTSQTVGSAKKHTQNHHDGGAPTASPVNPEARFRPVRSPGSPFGALR